MYKGTLTMSAAPPALRLFESYWAPLTHNMNGFLGWLVESIAKALNWEPVSARLMKVTHADDMNRQAAKLQLMMGRQISQTTGLKSVGMDFEDEQKQMLEEEKFVSDETQKMQEEMQDEAQMQQAVQGAAAGGAAPPNFPRLCWPHRIKRSLCRLTAATTLCWMIRLASAASRWKQQAGKKL